MIRMPPLLKAGRLSLMVLLIVLGVFQAGATIASSLFAKIVFDQIIAPQVAAEQQVLLTFAAAFTVLAALLGWMSMAERIIAEKIGQSYAEALRLKLYDHLMVLPQRTLQNRSQGAVLLRFVGDLTAVRQWVSLGLARLVVIGMTAIGSLSALAMIDQVLALTVGLILLFGTLLSVSNGQAMRQTSRSARQQMARLAAAIHQAISALSVLQVFGQSQRERERMLRRSSRVKAAMIEKATVSGKIRGLAEGFSAFAYGIALVVGAFQVHAGKTSPGTVLAALTIISLLVPKLRDLGRVQEYWHGFNVSRQKVMAFLTIPPMQQANPNAPAIKRGPGKLEFCQVNACILKDISVTAEAGSVIAIVGANGAGKSTLFSLVARLIAPDQGIIRLDGQDISQYSVQSVRQCLGIAGPDFPLLRGSLKKNLRYRSPEESQAEYKRIKALCGIDELVGTLPQGEKTRIAEDGKGLSAGQRQRIALARALLGCPPILLLDEADVNLDAQSGKMVEQVLAQHEGTVLLISHRREQIAKADMIWFFKNGQLLEVGRPADLLSGSGLTAQFFAQPIAEKPSTILKIASSS